MEGAKFDVDDFLKSAMITLPQDFQAEVQIEQETPAVQQSINAIQGENHLDAFSAFFNETFKEVDDGAHITKPETSTKRGERRNESSTSKRKTSKPDIVQDKERQRRNETPTTGTKEETKAQR